MELEFLRINENSTSLLKFCKHLNIKGFNLKLKNSVNNDSVHVSKGNFERKITKVVNSNTNTYTQSRTWLRNMYCMDLKSIIGVRDLQVLPLFSKIVGLRRGYFSLCLHSLSS